MPASTGRAIWSGSITFSLVSVPVQLFPIVSDKDSVSFHQYRISDASPIKFKRVAESDGEEVPFSEIAKGLEISPGNVVLVSSDELAAIRLPSLKEIALEHVVDPDDINPLLYSGKNYYIAPVQAGVRAYTLLRDALETSGQVGVVKVTLRSRSKESTGVLVAREGLLMLELLNWPDEIRTPQFPVLDSAPVLSQAERDMAGELIGAMAGKFDPSEYTDKYAAALNDLVEAKTNGQPLPKAPDAPASSGNLADALAASLAAKRANTPKASSAGKGSKKTASKK